MMKPGTIRSKTVLSKNPFCVRLTNDAEAFGDCAWSILNANVPQFVFIVIT